jgi:glycine/D-amino acid oxidase-like deaminating enzyme
MYRRGFLQMLALTATMAPTRKLWAAGANRVIVIGAGIMGSSIAYHMAKRGAQVTLLEKERPAAGTTRNSFAWLNSAGKGPLAYYEFNVAGIMGWRRLELEIGPDLPIQWGGRVAWSLPSKPEDVAERRKQLATQQALGYPVREVEAAEISKLVPGVVTGDVGFGNFCDLEGTIDPVVAATVLTAKAKGFGANVVYPCEITGMDLGTDRIRGVQTTKGKFEADYVVIAAGNGTPQIAQMAGFDVPLIESKGILAHSTPQPRVLNRIVSPPGGEMKQNFDGRIVTSYGSGESGESGNIQPDAELGRKYLDHVAKFFPATAGAKLDYMTLGHRVMPKDGHPIFDRAPKYPNLYVAAQHSAMTCGPIAGQLVSMEVLDQVNVDMMAPYRLSRFS